MSKQATKDEATESVLLKVLGKLEALLGKLPERIRAPVLRELTPLKQLFLQKRAPRFLFLGSIDKPMPELLRILFGITDEQETSDTTLSIFRWQQTDAGGRGELSILDGRGAAGPARQQIEQELTRSPADVILFLDEPVGKRRGRKAELQNLSAFLNWSETSGGETKIVGVSFSPVGPRKGTNKVNEEFTAQLARALPNAEKLAGVIAVKPGSDSSPAKQEVTSILGRALPNEARLEFIRIARDRQQQRETAEALVKSTSAICAAVGAQPIPLADLPVLTTLQLGMVSAIMYVSGRQRNVRAAAEFVGALGANVGAAMLLRESVRAVLKFVPGWGNAVCGLVAGGGTYAIGRAAIAFFIEGVSLTDARRRYVASRKKPARHAIQLADTAEQARR